jgi:hypothetical protein
MDEKRIIVFMAYNLKLTAKYEFCNCYKNIIGEWRFNICKR